jgi:hypothetical protein
MDSKTQQILDGYVGTNSSVTTTVYGAPFIEQYDIPTSKLTYNSFESNVKTEKEIRVLLDEIFLWLSGIKGYPETLKEIIPPKTIGTPEKAAVQVLRWVLSIS